VAKVGRGFMVAYSLGFGHGHGLGYTHPSTISKSIPGVGLGGLPVFRVFSVLFSNRFFSV
jgi:hypothetical protein